MLLDPELHYLDNAATTMVDPEIAGAIHEALLKDWANPSSLYEPAVETHEALTTARGQIARTLCCQAKDLYFTSCGSESNNLAVQGLAMARKNWGSKIVVSGFEHPSVQRPIRALKDRGFEVVEILPETDGHLDVAKLAAEVDKNTVLVSCMAVNNETGTLQDIAALSTAVKAKNSRCAVHVDAVQAWLRIPIDLKKWKNVDTLSVSGHKVHAPKGIGALFIRDSVRQTLCPPYLGGHQERGLRPGTENTPYIVGLGLAAAKGAKNLSDRNAHIRALNAQLRTGLEELAQQAPITLNSPADAVPEVLNFSTNCVNSQTFIEYLSGRHIYISGGSACDKGEPSHTLMAMGAPDLAVRTALRVSFCGDNTPEDVQALLDALKEARPQAIERATENATASFCLVTEGQFLSLGRKEGGYPWDYEGLPETPQSAGTGDNGESLFTFSSGGVDVAYLDADGTDNIYRMTTTVPGPRTLGGIQVGDSEDDVKAVYTGAVQMEAVGEDQFGADYALIHEPGGLSYCKHISFFITDGEVSAIQVEDLVDGRLLS